MSSRNTPLVSNRKKNKQSESEKYSERSSENSRDHRERLIRERKALQKEENDKKSKKTLPRFSELQAKALRIAKKYQNKYQDLSVETVTNLLTYVKELPKERGSDLIDDCIFMAQMWQHFDITNTCELERMYKATARLLSSDNKIVTVENYLELMCIFFTTNRKAQIKFVFSVHDVNNIGHISKNALRDLIKPMLEHLQSDDFEDEFEDTTFVVNTLMSYLDKNNDEVVDFEEFEELAENVPLMTQFMGLCVPDDKSLDIFKNKIIGKSNIEVAGCFRNERRRSLRNPDKSYLNSTIFEELYGIKLELP